MARRNTDQVYSTLQQVQRRITEAAAGADLAEDVAQPAEPSLLRDPPGPAQHPLRPSVGNGPRPGTVIGAPKLPTMATALSAPVPVATPAGGPVKAMLQLSSELASFLVVLWLVTLAIAYLVGHSQAPRPIDPGAGFASGPAGDRDPSAAHGSTQAAAKAEKKPKAGNNVLVVMSTRTVTPTEEQRFAAKADELNDIAHNSNGRYRPWFAVRKSRDGSLQLIWGSIDGKLGVDNTEWDGFRDELEAANPDYKGSYWLSLGDGK